MKRVCELEFLPELTYMPHFRNMYGSSLFYFHTGIFREEYLCESKFYGFIETLLKTKHIFDDPSQRNLPDKYPFFQWLIFLGRNDRRNRGEIYSRLGNRESSGDIYIDIIALELRIAPFGKHRYKEIDFPIWNTSGRTFRVAELRIS